MILIHETARDCTQNFEPGYFPSRRLQFLKHKHIGNKTIRWKVGREKFIVSRITLSLSDRSHTALVIKLLVTKTYKYIMLHKHNLIKISYLGMRFLVLGLVPVFCKSLKIHHRILDQWHVILIVIWKERPSIRRKQYLFNRLYPT